MALTDYLTTLTSDPLLDTDPAWRQFIIDHKAYIISSAGQQKVSPEVMTQCNYNLIRYLRIQNLQVNLAWIVLLINGLDSDIDFNADMLSLTLYVPSETLIQTLYQTYQTVSQVST